MNDPAMPLDWDELAAAIQAIRTPLRNMLHGRGEPIRTILQPGGDPFRTIPEPGGDLTRLLQQTEDLVRALAGQPVQHIGELLELAAADLQKGDVHAALRSLRDADEQARDGRTQPTFMPEPSPSPREPGP